VLLVTASVFINYIDRGNLATAAPLMQDELHLSASQLGVLLSAFYYGYVICMPGMGWLAERYGASSTAYATAKAGLAGLTRELARGLAPAVRVNGIAPGLVNSNWECSFGDIAAMARASVPLARVGEPEDYAEVIVYLCAGASYITGEVIPVTGGTRL
jgi:NAD(P)-dependent dehydrogenase (short-subunit alcohol dehydrogenase family)